MLYYRLRVLGSGRPPGGVAFSKFCLNGTLGDAFSKARRVTVAGHMHASAGIVCRKGRMCRYQGKMHLARGPQTKSICTGDLKPVLFC